MTEHEKLKEICDVIGYELDMKWLIWDKWTIFIDIWIWQIPIDSKTDIFTQEFMNKFNQYRIRQLDLVVYWQWKNSRLWEILDHLNTPVDYLYNLIKKND